MKKNVYDQCPYCGNKDVRLYDLFSSNDYETEFEVECQKCNMVFDVTVHQIPEFECVPRAASESGIATEQPITAPAVKPEAGQPA